MANIMTARELAFYVGLRTNPELYNERRARITDLDGEMLAKIYQKIKDGFGDEVAKEFVTMIQNIKLLSARKFLESFYALEKNNWKFSNEIQNEINEKEEDGGKLDVIYGYHASLKNDTDFIRNTFLANIGEKYDKKWLRFETYARLVRSRHDFDCDEEDDDDDDYAEYD